MKNADEYFIGFATHAASRSKDRSTQVGCVVIGPDDEIRMTGYNGFPRGVNDDVEARHQRPQKYQWTIHSEQNAIANAARVGVSLKGCRIYVPRLFPCAGCAGMIIQSGIIEVVAPAPDFDLPKWGDEFRVSVQMFDEAGVAVRYIGSEPSCQSDLIALDHGGPTNRAGRWTIRNFLNGLIGRLQRVPNLY